MNKVKKLNNGMRLLLIPMQNLYTVSIGVMVDVGSIKEDSPCNGYSHLIEHLMFKGTPTRNATDISREMDEIGAQMNAYTAKDETCYWTRTVYLSSELYDMI
ncbi:MAG: insulinase family protein, partial [Clostridia bacterium]